MIKRTARYPSRCYACSEHIWKGATVVLDGAKLLCAVCGHEAMRRDHAEWVRRADAFAAGKRMGDE